MKKNIEKVEYFANTPASEVIKLFQKTFPPGTCAQDTLAYFDQFAAFGTARDLAENIKDQSWAYWDLHVLGAITDSEVRKILIGKIEDPMIAFNLYLSLPWLTDEEDKLLEEKFKGKLPTAEKELADGIVKRAKNG